MGIPVRVQPKQEQRGPQRPTRGEVQVAATKFAKLLGQDESFAKELFGFAVQSVATSLATIAYARHLVRCYVAECKIQGMRDKEAEAPLRSFDEELADAKANDVASKNEARTLQSIPQGRPLKMSARESAVVVGKLKTLFDPKRPKTGEITPVEIEIPVVVIGPEGRNLRLGDWLIRWFLSGDALSAYEADLATARKADKAERANSGKAEAEEESDEQDASPDAQDTNGSGSVETAPAAS